MTDNPRQPHDVLREMEFHRNPLINANTRRLMTVQLEKSAMTAEVEQCG